MNTKSKKPKPPRVGEIVYLVNVGFPFNRTDDGHESWEGASGVVASNPAQKGAPGERMIYVRAFRPLRTGHERDTIAAAFFYPEQVKRETRPWLRKNLRKVFQAKNELAALRDKLLRLLPDDDIST